MSQNTGSTRKYFHSEVGWAEQTVMRRHRPIFSIAFLLVYISFFALIAFYAVTVKVPTRIEAPGRITSSKEPVPIRASAPFVVGKLFVKENQMVSANQVLLTSRESMAAADESLMRSYLARTRGLVTNNRDAACAKCNPEILALTKLYYSLKVQGDVQSMVSPVNDLLRELGTQIEAQTQIEAGVADLRREIRVKKQKLAEIDKRKARSILAKEVDQLESEILSAQTRIQERFQQSKLRITSTRSLIESRLREMEPKLELYGKTFNVLAPFAGRITNLMVKGEGELLHPSQDLMELVPAGTDLVAKIEVRNEDISQVKVGAEVIFSVDALPEVDYGTVGGTVLEILRAEDTDKNIQGTKGARSFPVIVQLKQQFLQREGERAPFLIGMSVRGRVVSEYQTIYHNFLRNVLRVTDKAGIH